MQVLTPQLAELALNLAATCLLRLAGKALTNMSLHGPIERSVMSMVGRVAWIAPLR